MEERPDRGLRSRLRGWSMATRLSAAFVGISLLALGVTIIVAVIAGQDLGRGIRDERLTALRSSAAIDVAAHLRGLRSTADALASSPQALDAVDRLTAAHAELLEVDTADINSELEGVLTMHREDYIDPLREVGRDVDLREISSANPASTQIQYAYVVDTGVIDEPAAIDDAGDGSTWTEVHAEFHPVYRDIVQQSELVDLFLIEPENGNVVYSVRKRPEIGTSLELGPFSGTILDEVTARVIADPEAGSIVSDLAFYNPALTEPVGVVASPIRDGDDLAGVLVLMYDSRPISDMLTAGGDWDNAGFPDTGQSYLVGADGLVRSEPRTFVENPQRHLNESEDAGLLTAEGRAYIDAAGTAVLTQPSVDSTVQAGLEGDSSVERRPTMVGGEAFGTTAAITTDGPAWFVVSEVDADVAEADINDFEDLLIVGTAIFIVLLAFLAVAWSNMIMRPVRAISERLSRGSEASRDEHRRRREAELERLTSDLDFATDDGARAELEEARSGLLAGDPIGDRIEVPTRSPIEFHRLAASFDAMETVLRTEQARVAVARAERLQLLRQMLPPGVADRVARGDVESLEEIPQATVVVIVVLGLADMVTLDDETSDHDLLEELIEELDALADRNGLERVKVIGDAYFAACGHDRPYIDHAPRAVTFAMEAQDAAREIGSATERGLDVAAAVHTGPVTAGTLGGARLLYDVWGPTVSSAHHLARRARDGQILATGSTREMLPDTYELAPADVGDGEPIWRIVQTPVRSTA